MQILKGAWQQQNATAWNLRRSSCSMLRMNLICALFRSMQAEASCNTIGKAELLLTLTDKLNEASRCIRPNLYIYGILPLVLVRKTCDIDMSSV